MTLPLLRRAQDARGRWSPSRRAFVWRPFFVRRSLGLAVVEDCAGGRFRSPAEAVGPWPRRGRGQLGATGWRASTGSRGWPGWLPAGGRRCWPRRSAGRPRCGPRSIGRRSGPSTAVGGPTSSGTPGGPHGAPEQPLRLRVWRRTGGPSRGPVHPDRTGSVGERGTARHRAGRRSWPTWPWWPCAAVGPSGPVPACGPRRCTASSSSTREAWSAPSTGRSTRGHRGRGPDATLAVSCVGRS